MSENLMNKWDQVQSPGRNELVFANRFKEYGAYQIRSQFSKNQSISHQQSLEFEFLMNLLLMIQKDWT